MVRAAWVVCTHKVTYHVSGTLPSFTNLASVAGGKLLFLFYFFVMNSMKKALIAISSVISFYSRGLQVFDL